MNKRLSLLIFLVVLLAGCSGKPADLSPSDEKLVPLYADLLMLNEDLKAPRPTLDSAAYQSRLHSILASGGLTQEELTKRLAALAQSPDLFNQFQSKVHVELESRKAKRPR
ncbi:MAG TPA: hypothetical protein VMH23_02485 [Bacteroidota bacterium]|nr:hypothetical protein [Bacteroidota bacterium]